MMAAYYWRAQQSAQRSAQKTNTLKETRIFQG